MENSDPSPRITVFQLLQKNLAVAGIIRKLSLQQYPFNRRVLIGFSTLFIETICIFKFTFFEAKTFSESTQSIYMGTVTVVIIVVLFIFVIKAKKLFEFIDDCENVVNTSESQRCQMLTTLHFNISQILIFCSKNDRFQRWIIRRQNPFLMKLINWQQNWMEFSLLFL